MPYRLCGDGSNLDDFIINLQRLWELENTDFAICQMTVINFIALIYG